VKPFLLAVQIPDGSYKSFSKRELSAFCSVSLSPQVLGMRQIAPESQRDLLPADKPKNRWPFPEDLVSGWVGQRVQVQLLNGSSWTGILRWNSRYTFLLGAHSTGEPEVLLFKHACCAVELTSQ